MSPPIALSDIGNGTEEPLPYINCGSGTHYGICRSCGKGHGYLVFRKERLPSVAVTKAAKRKPLLALA